MDQTRISQFADVTEDWQFVHLDPERAAQTAFGGTVAHGYLTLSMLSAMAYDVLDMPENASASVNYGFDKVRFLTPVPSGARIRGVFHCASVEDKGAGRVLLRLAVQVDIEGKDTPALSVDWLVMYLP